MGLIFNLQPFYFCRCLSFIFISSLNLKTKISFCSWEVKWEVSFSLSICFSPSIHISIHMSGELARPLIKDTETKICGEKPLGHTAFTNYHCESSCYGFTLVSKWFHHKMCSFIISKESSWETKNLHIYQSFISFQSAVLREACEWDTGIKNIPQREKGKS